MTQNESEARTENIIQTLREMAQRREVVVFGKAIEDFNAYPVAGMQARIIDVKRGPDDDAVGYAGVIVLFDFSDMDQYNAPFEGANMEREEVEFCEQESFTVNAFTWEAVFKPLSSPSMQPSDASALAP